MDDVTKQGRTVLFVSHNMAALHRLCNRGLLLDRGQVVCYDSVDGCVARYEQMMINGDAKTSAAHVIYESLSGKNNSQFEIKRVETLDCEGEPKDRVYTWDSFVIRVNYEAQRRVVGKGALVIVITTLDGTPLLYLSNQPDCAVPMNIEIGQNEVECYIKRVPLSAGEYLIQVGLGIPYQEWLLKLETLGRIEIGPRDVFNSGLSPISTRALLAIPHEWRIK